MISAVGRYEGFFVQVDIDGHKAIALIDTGAVATFVSEAFATSNKLTILPWRGEGYQLANGQVIKPIGQTKAKLSLTLEGTTKTAEVNLHVMKNLTNQVVFGANLIRCFKLKIDAENDKVSF